MMIKFIKIGPAEHYWGDFPCSDMWKLWRCADCNIKANSLGFLVPQNKMGLDSSGWCDWPALHGQISVCMTRGEGETVAEHCIHTCLQNRLHFCLFTVRPDHLHVWLCHHHLRASVIAVQLLHTSAMFPNCDQNSVLNRLNLTDEHFFTKSWSKNQRKHQQSGLPTL